MSENKALYAPFGRGSKCEFCAQNIKVFLFKLTVIMPKPKLNQPCPSGSGRKFKRCCLHDWKEEGKCQQDEQCATGQCEACNYDYRFRVGDRVEALFGKDGFKPGTIVALDYKENGWLGGVPYQISLDGDTPHYIYAPFDDDGCVRALLPSTSDASPTNRPRRRRRQTAD